MQFCVFLAQILFSFVMSWLDLQFRWRYEEFEDIYKFRLLGVGQVKCTTRFWEIHLAIHHSWTFKSLSWIWHWYSFSVSNIELFCWQHNFVLTESGKPMEVKKVPLERKKLALLNPRKYMIQKKLDNEGSASGKEIYMSSLGLKET